MKIIISNEAHTDIESIFNYIALDSPRYANETLENIYSRIYGLEYSAYIGKYVPELKDKQYRELIYKSYKIVYSVSENTNEIYIHFVVHSARNFKKFFNSYIKNIFNF